MVVTVIVADTVTVVVDFGSWVGTNRRLSVSVAARVTVIVDSGSWVGTNRPLSVSAIHHVMLHLHQKRFVAVEVSVSWRVT